MKKIKKVSESNETVDLEEMNKKVLEISKIDNFCEIQRINEPTFEISYLDIKDCKVLTIKQMKEYVCVESHQICVSVTQEQVTSLKEKWNIDVLAMVKNAIVQEAGMQLTKQYINKISEISNKNYLAEYTMWDKFKVYLYKIFKKEYKKKIIVKGVKDLLTKILSESNKIASMGRFSYGNFAICNLKTGLALQHLSEYTYANPDSTPTYGNIYPIGTIAGITIYVDPNMLYTDTNVYIGRKIKNNEPGVKLFFKDSEMSKVITQGLGAPKIEFRLRYTITSLGEATKYQYRKIEYKDDPKKFLV